MPSKVDSHARRHRPVEIYCGHDMVSKMRETAHRSLIFHEVERRTHDVTGCSDSLRESVETTGNLHRSM